ncbi:site-specific DNA-methyltransferase (adenine-specific) [Maritalea myrionectae]|uniref:Site-specific DNA-methyltransferase (Adenine-specific) n=1 Tax=Maritalea myrionectae TaxID=454601 RepID=A0A2R4ME86_9HYPH|nr:DNA adenine methylase [Maritalea myrionectae]AVX04320.1 site-specific DNA-methyltransferase (adenine-specific) [Maritalea myrionectae]
MVEQPRRPVLRWHGGKWMLAPWIIEHFPAHQVYVEPFGGAASVLMRKTRSYAEIYNDLDCEVVNLFRVLRSDKAKRLVEAVRQTPFARDEFKEAYQRSSDPVERARRLIIRSFMGFGSNGHNRVTGFRANSNRSGTTPTHDWVNYPDSLATVVKRLEGVTVENRDAVDVMAQHDAPTTLHYVDPPYVMATRDGGEDYAHEMDDQDHAELLEFLKSLSGMVVLSGYPHPLYEVSLNGWRRIERKALADGAKPRTEVLWINAAAAQRLDEKERQLTMFGAAQ